MGLSPRERGALDLKANRMSNMQRVYLIVCLTLAMIATAYAGGYFEWWLKHVLSIPPYTLLVASGLKKTAMLVVWLAPLLVIPKLRDIGSFRLPLTWTLLLLLPVLALNLYFFCRAEFSWPTRFAFAWIGMAAGIFEELVFRGYAFRRSSLSRPRLVIFTSATCFALMHFINLTNQPLRAVLDNIPLAFAIGLGFGIIRLVSGSVAWCMLVHGAIDSARGWFILDVTYQKLFLIAGATTFIASLLVLYLHPRMRNHSLTYDTTTQNA